MWHVKQNPMAALSLDAENAFNSVAIPVLVFKSLWIWIWLPKAAVHTNDYIHTSTWHEEHDSWASVPTLSPQLEPRAIAIPQNPNTSGITIGSTIHKLMLYADDILVLSDPEV